MRPISNRERFAAATLALLLAGSGASAQSVGLRGLDQASEPSNATPASPLESTPKPADTLPPSTDGSPAAADETAPTSDPGVNAPDDGSPNYGKARKRKSNVYRLSPKMAKGLSPLVPYRRKLDEARLQRQNVRAKDAERPTDTGAPLVEPTTPAPNVAVLPSYPRPKRNEEELDPFAPIGVHVGEFILKPAFEADGGYDTNPNQVSPSGAKRSIALRQEGDLDIKSDFSSGNSITGTLRGAYSEYPQNSTADRPDVNAVLDGKTLLGRNDTIDSEARFYMSTQTPGSALLATPNSVFITNRPLIISEGATLGETHDFGRFSLGLKGTFDRTEYGDATQSNGTIYQFSWDDYNDYGLVARANYEITPGIIPFTEFGFDTRVRDNPIDLSGYARDSIGISGKAGVTFDLVGHFTGNVSAGYLDRHYQDKRLPDVNGPSIDAALVYAMTGLTTAKVTASTFASETTVAGASGAISRTFQAEIDHRLFRNFTLSGIATFTPNQYVGVSGHELYTTYTLKALYNVSREVALTASASHEKLYSTFTGEAFNDNTFLVGMRLQR